MEKLKVKTFDIPPVWLVIFMVAVYFQTGFWNPFGFDNSFASLVGWLLIVFGFVIFGWASLQFHSHKTSIIPRQLPKSFIAQGPYKYSRNPIYFADAIILLGFALIQGSIIGILLVPVFSRLIARRFIIGEEAGLKAEFPEEFAPYCTKTRRWI